MDLVFKNKICLDLFCAIADRFDWIYKFKRNKLLSIDLFTGLT